ncbi:Ger(x)C family spore germination protein [Paenibacillus athensensis]|nr:Ger(x)C family spore germination protein [Paenibacillus athensensis]MCD1258055.1 Ger(x)C family spore germination protein [Paenibacillus athensensis]
MGKRLNAAGALLLAAGLLTGCWNQRESDTVEYVLAAGIDYNERGQIVLTVLTPVLPALKPLQGAKSEQKKTLSVAGNTTFEACDHYIQLTGRRLFWSHLQVLLIGEQAARKGVTGYLDFFSSNPELRGTANIAVVKGRALDILEASPDITENAATYLKALLGNMKQFGDSPQIEYTDFARALADPKGGQPYAPMVKLYQQSDFDRKQIGVPPYEGKDTNQSVVYYLEGAAVFRDDRMVGYLDDEQTLGLLWARNELRSTIVVVPCRNEACSISLNVNESSSSSRIKVRYADGRAQISVNVSLTFNIGDKASSSMVIDDDYIRYLEEALARKVKKEIAAAFDQAVGNHHADVFAFGNRLEDWRPRLWEQIRDQWETVILPQAQIDITVTTQLRRTSRNLYSPWVRPGDR